jgi:hypothetical protein
MAALGTTLVTMADVAKSKDKKIGNVAEVLVQHNPALNDIPYMEMNEGTRHIEEIRSALPAVYYRKANQAIPASKTTTEERTFTAAHFESKSQLDQAVAMRGGADRVAYNRWNQAQGHIQAHAIEHADLMFYGSPTDDARKVAGFADIFSTLSASEATSAQILDAGGTTNDLTSIYLVLWGERSVFGIYPKGTQSGLKRTDRSTGGNLVQINALDVNGNAGNFWGYEEQFEIDHGLVVKDYRQVVRICNIDPALLIAGTGPDLIELMAKALYTVDSLENGTPVFYMNRTLEAWLDLQSMGKVGAGGGVTYENYQGKPILHFRKVPVRRADALVNTEDRIT